MIRILCILLSAIVAAGLFIFARAHVTEVSGLTLASTSLLAAPVPMIAAALSFPALYLIWEQSEL
jgi:hypothetical protein